MKIVSPETMADIDSRSISEFGIPGDLLMENAGIKCWQKIREFIPLYKPETETISIAAGPGNNGGDALVIARAAWVSGYRNIKVILLKEEGGRLYSMHKNICRKFGIPVLVFGEDNSAVASALNNSGIIVDGLTGTGLRGVLKGNSRELTALINKSNALTVSIDIPSGLGNGFKSEYPAVKADITLTIGLSKTVLYNPVSRVFAGDIIVVEIGFPPELLKNPADSGELYTAGEPLLPEIERWAYKGIRGHTAVFAGAQGTSGAAVLASLAAGRSRSGLVTLYSDAGTYSSAASQLKSIMVKNMDNQRGTLNLDGITSLLAGPGWGRQDRVSILEQLLKSSIPGVLDADALHLLSDIGKRNRKPLLPGGKWVLTPHPGEFEKLSGIPRDEFLADPLPFLRKSAADYGAVIVLKSHVPFIVSPEGDYSIVDGMNPSLGTGGTGDILAGIIAGLIAQGLEPYSAAVKGVILHQSAGRLCFKERGWFLAEDLLPYISRIAADREE